MVRLFSLGQCELWVNGETLRPSSGQLFNVVLHLAVEAGRRLPRRVFCSTFWPTAREREARHSLRQLAYLFRQMGSELDCNDDFLALDPRDVQLDYRELPNTAPTSPDTLLQEFLPGYSPRVSGQFDRWLQSTRDRAHDYMRGALLSAINRYRLSAAWMDMVAASRRCLELDPLNEEATLSLAEATAMLGNKIAALRILDRYMQELGEHGNVLRLPAAFLQQRIRDVLPPHPAGAHHVSYVGRRDVLLHLNTQIELLRLRKGGTVVLCGPQGIGKSRTITEVVRRASHDDLGIVSLGCEHSPFGHGNAAIRSMIAELLRMPGALGCSPTSLARLQRIAQSNLAITDEDGDLLSSPALTAIVDLVDAISHERAMLIVAEDIDRVDIATAGVLSAISSATHERAVFVLMSARTRPDTAGFASFLQTNIDWHELGALDSDDASTLLDALTSNPGLHINPELRKRFLTLAHGNPGVLIDLVDQWWVQGPAFQMPPSLKRDVDQRLSRIDELSRRVLQVCALFGEYCTVDRLGRTGLYSQAEVLEAVDVLGRAGLLTLRESALTVTDEMVSQQLLANCSDAAVQFLHNLIALVLREELTLPRYSPITWAWARHQSKAGNSHEAVAMLTVCADDALATGQPKIAVSILERAKQLCITTEEELAITSRLVRSFGAAENWCFALRAAEHTNRKECELRTRFEQHSDLELTARIARWHLDEEPRALLHHASACLADGAASAHHRAEAAVQVLVFAHNMGDPDAMRLAHEAVSDLKCEVGIDDPTVLTADMIFHSVLGDVQTAAAVGERLLTITRATAPAPELAHMLRCVAVPLRFAGRFDEARALLTEALSITTELGLVYGCLKASDMIGTTFLEQGLLTESWDWYVRSLQWTGGTGDPTSGTFAHNLGAKVAILQQRAKQASKVTGLRPRAILKHPVLRLQCEELAIWLSIQIQKGKTSFDKALVTTFENGFEMLKRLGKQDFAAYTLASLKQATGRQLQGLELLNRYLEHDRRERGPVPRFLLELRHALK